DTSVVSPSMCGQVSSERCVAESSPTCSSSLEEFPCSNKPGCRFFLQARLVGPLARIKPQRIVKLQIGSYRSCTRDSGEEGGVGTGESVCGPRQLSTTAICCTQE